MSPGKPTPDAAREVTDRQPPALPVAQLCVWLAAFCVGLLALLISMPGESRDVPPPSVSDYTPDPDYLASRCREPRTGFITADLPNCMFVPEDVDIWPGLLDDSALPDHSGRVTRSSSTAAPHTSIRTRHAPR